MSSLRPVILALFIILAAFLPLPSSAQKPVHSPNKAALYSAVLPGLGQAYNRKYWKIPVVYAGFGTLYYFINLNNKEYLRFKNAYEFKSGYTTDPSKYNEYVDMYTESGLLDARNYYRRNRDLSIILASVWYLLNITDAAVDAYLFDYDIGDQLSLKLAPDPIPDPRLQYPGIILSLQF